jgi:hypothetical protein
MTNLPFKKPELHVTLDPTWSQDLLDNIDITDTHNHSPGKGAPIHSDAIDIDGDISMSSYAISNTKDISFTNYASNYPTATNALYWKNSEFYLNNGSGIPLQITIGGATRLYTTSYAMTEWYVGPIIINDYYVDETDPSSFFSVKTSNGIITINLPFAGSVNSGRALVFKDIDGDANINNVIIKAQLTNTIETTLTQITINQSKGWLILVSDGSANWHVLLPGIKITNTPSNEYVIKWDAPTNSWMAKQNIVSDTLRINGSTVPESTEATAHTVLNVGSTTGVLQYSKIVDANVDGSAAIAGTKISPDFGSQTIQTTGNLSCGGASHLNEIILQPIYCNSNYDLGSNYYKSCLVLVDTTSTAFTVTLPIASLITPGSTIIIKDIGGNLSTNNLTISKNVSQTINKLNANKVVSANYGTWIFTSYGTGWYV